MADDPKDTIYIDVEDEITTVIDKVLASNKKLVALVLPKRASVFQSIVNMKLLKRKADEAKKSIVLVTAEAGLLPLAGAVGLHVAKSLSSKPEIPAAPIMAGDTVEADEDDTISDLPEEEPEKGEVAEEVATAAVAAAAIKKAKQPPKDDKGVETIELDNSDNPGDEATDTAMPAAAIATAEAKKKKAKKDKKMKVPNFERFRLLAIVGGIVLIGLIVLFILMFKVFPHATIYVKTNAQNVDVNMSFNMSTTSTKFSPTTGTVPAKVVTETKTYTATTNATGQQNNGQKATGTVSMTATECTNTAPADVPAGTGITTNGNTYITQSDTSFVIHSGPKNGCFGYTAAGGPTSITAQNGGSTYNASGNFNVPGRTDVSASGSAAGGTDDNVTVVSQTDITTAENKVTPDSTGAKTDLTNQLTQANFYPIGATFTAATPTISPNANAGTAASSVTVTETVKYTMYGVVKSDLNQLLNNNIKSQVNNNQNILANGLNTASYTVGSSPTNLNLVTTAVVGPNISVAQLKKEVTGLKAGEIQVIVKANPDVSSVTVKLSPFYVSKAPVPSKITINIAKPTNSPQNAQ